MFLNNTCLVAGKQKPVTNATTNKTEGAWIDNMMRFSKTEPTHLGPLQGLPYDTWQLGWDDVKNEMVSGSKGGEATIELFRKVKVRKHLEDFIAILSREKTPLLNKPLAKMGKIVMENVIHTMLQRRSFLGRLKCEHGCEDLVQLIDACSLLVESAMKGDLDSSKEVAAVVGTTPPSSPRSPRMGALHAIPISERYGDITSIYKALSETKGATPTIEIIQNLKGDKVKINGFALPPAVAEDLCCRLIYGLYTHYNQLRSLRCDLTDITSCKACASSTGVCKWERGKCYNSLLHELKSFVPGAEQLGIINRVISEELLQLVHMPPPTEYAGCGRTISTHAEGYGMYELMKALYGEELIAELRFIPTASARRNKLNEAMEAKYQAAVVAAKEQAKTVQRTVL
jgi:hypothetical protein